MAKINYSKVEQMLQETLQKLQYKQLAEGKPIISSRAQEFYGITNEARPVTEEVVEKMLDEESTDQQEKNASEETSAEEISQKNETLLLEAFEAPSLDPLSDKKEDDSFSIQKTPHEETITSAKKRTAPLPKRPILDIDLSRTSEKFAEKASPLYLLRQHIFWMKLQHLEARYEILKTSKEEVFAWRKKSRLTEDDSIRIKGLLKKAHEFRTFWLKKQGIDSPETLIEQQKKKHHNKRFNVREKWLPI